LPSVVSNASPADNRDDIAEFLPKAPHQKNGKRVALIGAGPSSLTVANDLMPLGYDVVIYEKLAEPGGLMRINIPVVSVAGIRCSMMRLVTSSTWASIFATTRR
jgi:cation diffusion facilitator CzcD-associated flavoprotein CzcO